MSEYYVEADSDNCGKVAPRRVRAESPRRAAEIFSLWFTQPAIDFAKEQSILDSYRPLLVVQDTTTGLRHGFRLYDIRGWL